MSAGLIWLSVAAIFTLPTALVLFIIFRNHKAADLYYQGLYHSLEQERLGKLLKKEGISLEQYVRSNSSVEVYKAIRKCQTCYQHGQCDTHLESVQQGIPENCENKDSIENSKVQV